MECGKGETKNEKGARFDGLLQTFSHHVNKVVGDSGFQKFSDELILNATFPKHVSEPVERYLGISPAVRLDAFFESLRPFDIVVGKVTSAVLGQQVHVTLLYRVDGQRRYISDLNISGVIDPQNNKLSSTDELVTVGDRVKGVVTYVNQGVNVVHMSFEEKYLREDQIRHFPLGKICDDDEGESLKSVSDDDDHQVSDSHAYKRDLERSSDFVDPHSIKRVLNELKLPEECKSFLGNSSPVGIFESADVMRERQASKWSMDMVGAGVKHFREKRLKEAMKCFDQSISFYPKNVEAFVARGALRANKNELKEAVKDFHEALKINPKHRNARKYIIETLSNIAKRQEKDMKWKDASHSYKEILNIDPENKEALKQYNQIKKILIPKISTKTSKELLSPAKAKTLSVKSKERLKKLKSLLQAEAVESDSSSSSSSSSSTESNSSGDEMWVEKPNVSEKHGLRGKGCP